MAVFAVGFSPLGSTEPGNSFPGDPGGTVVPSLSTLSTNEGVVPVFAIAAPKEPAMHADIGIRDPSSSASLGGFIPLF